MASWNILNLGASTDVTLRAEIVSRFDIVALQEIENPIGLQRLEREVEEHTSEGWSTHISSQAGSGGAAEFYGFIWRDKKVSQIDGPTGNYPEVEDNDFSREPGFATFQSGAFVFTMVNVHITWGNSKRARELEVDKLSEVIQYVESLVDKGTSIVVAGDFNIDGSEDHAFAPLAEHGFIPMITSPKGKRSVKTFSTYSTSRGRVGSRLYDNLWISPCAIKRVKGGGSVFKPHLHYYQSSRAPHLKVRRKISDHCPVWADFGVM